LLCRGGRTRSQRSARIRSDGPPFRPPGGDPPCRLTHDGGAGHCAVFQHGWRALRAGSQRGIHAGTGVSGGLPRQRSGIRAIHGANGRASVRGRVRDRTPTLSAWELSAGGTRAAECRRAGRTRRHHPGVSPAYRADPARRHSSPLRTVVQARLRTTQSGGQGQSP
jgi:hypothetical protein